MDQMKDTLPFGEFIRSERVKKGLTLRKFAKSIDISATFISLMERGDVSPPSENNIHKIAIVLGLDPDYLIVMARKVPTEVQEMFFDRPQLVGFLRRVHKKSDAELERMENSDEENRR